MGVTEHHISRRDVIKKGAVAGAIFWSAPVIESVVSRAAAQSGGISLAASYIFVEYTCTANGTTTTYYVKFSGSICEVPTFGNGNPDTACPSYTGTGGDCSYFSVSGTATTTTVSLLGTAPSTCQITSGFASCGPGTGLGCPDGVVATGGGSITFTC